MRCILLVAFLIVSGVSNHAIAQTPESIENGKKATALVEIRDGDKAKGFGSAFCIDPSGIFITNAHVAQAINGASLKLVINAGETDQRSVMAEILRADKTNDLAVLKASEPGKYASLALGSADSLFDTEEVTAFGYPFGIGLALDPRAYPAISVNSGRVTSLRKKAGELDLIQVDAALNPGNSGGPVIDGKGNVVGVVQMGLHATGINFAIPVSRVRRFLDEPIISFEPTSIAYSNRARSQTFRANLIMLGRSPAVDSADLEVAFSGQKPRHFTSPIHDYQCAFDFIPVPLDRIGNVLTLVVKFENGTVTGQVADQTLQVAGQPRKLSSVQEIERGNIPGAGGGATTGLDAVEVDLGGQTVKLNLQSARSVRISAVDPSASTGPLEYTLTIRSGATVVSTTRGAIAFTGVPGSGSSPSAEGGDAAMDSSSVRPHRGGPVTSPDDIQRPMGQFPDKEPDLELTRFIGGGAIAKAVYSKTHRPVLGLRIEMSTTQNRDGIRDIEPLYDKPDMPGKKTVFGKDGYVVGGLIVAGDDTCKAFKIVWLRYADGKADPNDRYESDWYGTPGDTSVTALAGNGETVIGIFGKIGGPGWQGIGLVLAK
jgi:serine protease Do